MYHAAVPWLAHVFLFNDFSWTNTFMPGGAIGVVLKSKFLSMTVTTEIKPVTELNQKDFWKFKNNHRIKDM